MPIEQLATSVFGNLDLIWTFSLMFARYSGLIIELPGIGYGQRGKMIRVPMIMMLSMASMISIPRAAIPSDILVLAAAIGIEFVYGYLVGMTTTIIVAGVQLGSQIATNTMGLAGAQMFDPTTGTSVSDIAKIQGDLTVLMFLLLGGHYMVIESASTLSNSAVMGLYQLGSTVPELFINRVSDIFRVGAMISAPIVVATMLTQFVMGLISKAVPTVNIFIISFPLTIGIGLIMTVLALPELMKFLEHELHAVGGTIDLINQSLMP